MKKLFALLLLAPLLFVACDGDEEEKPYFNPVEGEWVYTTKSGDTETRVYSKDFNVSSIIDSRGLIKETDLGKYTINETYLQYEKTGNKHHYKINKDTLALFDPIDGWNISYIRKKND